jgi:uncharacterized protein HemY
VDLLSLIRESEKAIEMIEEFTTTSCQSGLLAPALIILGRLYLRTENWKRANEVFSRAAAIEPSSEVLLGKMEALNKLGR